MDKTIKEKVALWHLKNCPLFTALTPAELGAVFECSRIVSFGAKEIVPTASLEEPAFWVIKRGHVKLTYIDHNGNQATVMILSPGDIMGSHVGDDQDGYGEHCETITSVCLCRITQTRFRQLLDKHPNVVYQVTKSSFQRIYRLQARLADLMVRSVEPRLALVLLDLERQVGEDDPQGGRLLGIPLSHSDLAHLIGSSREMVTHVIGRFRKQGLVSTARERIVLHDLPALEEIRDAC